MSDNYRLYVQKMVEQRVSREIVDPFAASSRNSSTSWPNARPGPRSKTALVATSRSCRTFGRG